MKLQGVSRDIALRSLIFDIRLSWVVSAMLRPLYPQGVTARVVQEAGWAPGTVWTGWIRENLLLSPGFGPRTFKPVASLC